MKTIIVLAIFIIISGCASLEAYRWRPIMEGADYGVYPNDYRDIVKKWYSLHLKDPSSVIFLKFSKPRKDYVITDSFKKEAIFGHSICATVNSKNSYGGFTGATDHWFLIRNGVLVSNLRGDYKLVSGSPINCVNSF